MLLRFAFSNFLSVRDPQELLLTASALKDQPNYLLKPESVGRQVVPVAGIYGANASGKTNVFLALQYLIRTVLYSHTQGEPGGGTKVTPFGLDLAWEDRPSRFEIDFILGGTRYHFGFSVTRQEVVEEWLLAYPRGRRQEWYRREAATTPMAFGNFLTGRNRVIEELTRPNSLFISAAAQNNHEQLLPIYNYFRDSIIMRLDERAEIVNAPRLVGMLATATDFRPQY